MLTLQLLHSLSLYRFQGLREELDASHGSTQPKDGSSTGTATVYPQLVLMLHKVLFADTAIMLFVGVYYGIYVQYSIPAQFTAHSNSLTFCVYYV